MIMQIFLISKFRLRSESAWWYKDSLNKKHLEVVTNQLVTENNAQQRILVSPKLLKFVINFSWVHVFLSVILVSLVGVSVIHCRFSSGN